MASENNARRGRRAGAVTVAAVALLAGCGGSGRPRLAHQDAAQLISLAHRIAAEPACGQARDIPRLQAAAIALVNAHRVPAALQDPLMSGVAALGEQTPVCLPPVTTSAVTPPARPPGHSKHKGHGHGPGKGD